MDVSIIIVNYNTKQLLADCIASIYKYTTNIKYEIIVSDNGSEDGSKDYVLNLFPNVIYIENNENLGFGRANNVGVKKASGKYIFLLNSDTVLLNNAIYLFFEYAEKNENLLLGSYLLDRDMNIGASYGKFEKYFTYIKRFQYDFLPKYCRTILKNRAEKNRICKKEEKIVDFLSGADLFIKKEIFSELGGFDENIFMYSEDSDLCRRAALKGYYSKVITSPEIMHLEGQSSTSSSRKLIMKEKSLLYYLRKYSTSDREFRKITNIYFWVSLLRFLSFSYKWDEKKSINKNLYTNIKLMRTSNE